MAVTTLEELMEAGVHFGHQTKRWNPKMKTYIWGKRNGIYIIDLTKTLPLLEQACEHVKNLSAAGKKIIFVGTKKQAADIVVEEANRAGVHYVNKRWLGGTLTNSSVIRSRINHFRELEDMKKNGHFDRVGKKEAAMLNRQLEKLERSLGGLKDLRGNPDLLIIVDQGREINAVTEAHKAGVQTMCLLDTNGDPTLCDFNIPGNDDALKSIRLVVGKLADSIIEGKQLREAQGATKKDDVLQQLRAKKAEAAEAKQAQEKEPVAVGVSVKTKPAEPQAAEDSAGSSSSED